MSYRDRQRLVDIQAAIDAIRSHRHPQMPARMSERAQT
jgi:hypothetical protein